MTTANPTLVEMQRTIGDTLRAHWRLYVFQGVLMIILGVLAVAAPAFATLTVDIYVGWLFLISGVLGLIAMFSARNVPVSCGPLSPPSCPSLSAACCCGSRPKARCR